MELLKHCYCWAKSFSYSKMMKRMPGEQKNGLGWSVALAGWVKVNFEGSGGYVIAPCCCGRGDKGQSRHLAGRIWPTHWPSLSLEGRNASNI